MAAKQFCPLLKSLTYLVLFPFLGLLVIFSFYFFRFEFSAETKTLFVIRPQRYNFTCMDDYRCSNLVKQTTVYEQRTYSLSSSRSLFRDLSCFGEW